MFRKNIFKPKFFGPSERKTKDQEKFVKEKFGLHYGGAKRISEVARNGDMEKALELFERDSKLKGLKGMSEKKKLGMVKELSRLNI